jgi:hypothetical protein
MYKENTVEWYKLNHAFMMMKANNNDQQRYVNSRLYELARKNFSVVMSQVSLGDKNSQYGTKWISNPVSGVNQKINKDSEIPSGWVSGRNKEIRTCNICCTTFIIRISSKTKHCSQKCIRELLSRARPVKRKPVGFITKKEEFLSLYRSKISITECLISMGYSLKCRKKKRIAEQWLRENLNRGSS